MLLVTTYDLFDATTVSAISTDDWNSCSFIHITHVGMLLIATLNYHWLARWIKPPQTTIFSKSALGWLQTGHTKSSGNSSPTQEPAAAQAQGRPTRPPWLTMRSSTSRGCLDLRLIPRAGRHSTGSDRPIAMTQDSRMKLLCIVFLVREICAIRRCHGTAVQAPNAWEALGHLP